MKYTLSEAIKIVKKYKTEVEFDMLMSSEVSEAIDTVVAHLNTENISELDENLDEKAIETPDNQGGLSNKLDEKFSPELLQTYYPFMEEMEGLLVRKKLSMVAIANAQSIIVRCHLHGMEVGWDEALRFKELQK